YLASRAHDPVFEALLTNANANVRTAAAIAMAHVKRGEISPNAIAALAAAAAKKRLRVKEVAWLGGDLAFFAVCVLAALPRTDETDEALSAAVLAAGTGAT